MLRRAPALEFVDLKDNPLPARIHEHLQDLSMRLRIELSPRQLEEWEDLNV
jgi:hypothetical protein